MTLTSTSQTYSNITLHGPSQEEVVEALQAENASGFISATDRKTTFVFHDTRNGSEGLWGRFEKTGALAAALSKRLNCPALAVQGCREDFLWVRLYERGTMSVDYDSSRRTFGGALRLAKAFHVGWLAPLLWAVMAWPRTSVLDESRRHFALLSVLSCPPWGVAASCRTILDGELPDGLTGKHLKRVFGSGATENRRIESSRAVTESGAGRSSLV